MNDAEAEAVLVALGNVLEWKHSNDRPKMHCGYHGSDFYYVVDSLRLGKSKPVEVIVIDYRLNPAQILVRRRVEGKRRIWQGESTEAAKAACERHFAMGKWE